MPMQCSCGKAVFLALMLSILTLGFPRLTTAQESVSGSPGSATERAVINFGDLADEETAATPPPPKVIHLPLPGPSRALPESESRQPPGTESELAATAAALRAQGCRSRRNTGTTKNPVLEQQ